jgi:hypothetical protein
MSANTNFLTEARGLCERTAEGVAVPRMNPETQNKKVSV